MDDSVSYTVFLALYTLSTTKPAILDSSQFNQVEQNPYVVIQITHECPLATSSERKQPSKPITGAGSVAWGTWDVWVLGSPERS